MGFDLNMWLIVLAQTSTETELNIHHQTTLLPVSNDGPKWKIHRLIHMVTN